ncbi:MAG: outer membrane beta-barrel protein [Chitinophagaceae bacterium]|nr:outer membrane beta-barrel protein [Chitinophagaceae bacterium]
MIQRSDITKPAGTVLRTGLLLQAFEYAAKGKAILLVSFLITFSVFCTAQTGQNQLGLTVSAPWMNNYRFYNYYDQKKADKSGFIGFGAGGFYKNRNNKVLLNASIGFDATLPFGEPEYAPGSVRDHIYAIALDVTYSRRLFHKVYLFAGPGYTNYWFRLNSSDDSVQSYNRHDRTFGLSAGIEYQVISQISAAVTYRPAIVSLDRKQYWHMLSASVKFELSFRNW